MYSYTQGVGLKHEQSSKDNVISHLRRNINNLEEKCASEVSSYSSVSSGQYLSVETTHDSKLCNIDTKIQRRNDSLEVILNHLETTSSGDVKNVLTSISEKISDAQCQMLILSIKDYKRLSDETVRQIIAKTFTELNSFI